MSNVFRSATDLLVQIESCVITTRRKESFQANLNYHQLIYMRILTRFWVNLIFSIRIFSSIVEKKFQKKNEKKTNKKFKKFYFIIFSS